MGVFENLPYTNFHETNLDWVTKTVKQAEEQSADAVEKAEQAVQKSEQTEEYVNTYFEKLDVQQEINNKLDSMADDGSLGDVTEPYIPPVVEDWLDEHITQPTNVVVDSSLSVSGAAADARAVGDVIYGDRVRAAISIEPSMAWYRNFESLTSVADMPTESYFSAAGDSLQNKLGNMFTWTLATGITYTIIKKFYIAGPYYEWWLYRHNLSEIYHGRTYEGSNGIVWSKLNSDIAAAIYGTKDMSDYGAYPLMAELRDTSAITTVADLPYNTLFSMSGSDLQEKLPDTFTWTLRPEVTYTVKKYPRGSGLYEIFIYNGSMSEMYCGRKVLDSTTWEKIPTGLAYEDDYEYVYTDLDAVPGWVTTGGEIITPENVDPPIHTQMLPIKPNSRVYMSASVLPADYKCAFYGKYGEFLEVRRVSDLINTNYKRPNGYNTGGNYSNTYYMNAPERAYFIVMNMIDNTQWLYRQFISSKPIFGFRGTGNYRWSKDAPFYNATKNRKLCVIGASSVMIDRLERPAISQYISGYQEYLIPWFDLVESYGYSGTPWGNTNGYDSSIYNEVAVKQLDITAYDTFILGYSLNGTTVSNMGTYNSNDRSTAMGGINGVIDYIYSKMPTAKIYVTNLFHNYLPNSSHAPTDAYNEAIPQLCKYRGVELIDLENGCGINQNTLTTFTYDNTHPNQQGMRLIGECMRRAVVGF